MKRVFLIVLDSFGAGESPDAKVFGDEGSDTLRAVASSKFFNAPNLSKLGLFNLDNACNKFKQDKTLSSFCKIEELSASKDTTTGHWEMMGIITKEKMETYPHGFPQEILGKIEQEWGRKALCNLPYSGTEVIKDYGQEHIKTGNLIVYTSADSVFQIAAHEDVVPLEKLYEYCKIARKHLMGKYIVGRVIARPFIGEYPNFERTPNRHDYSLTPPKKTVLNYVSEQGKKVVGVGKIKDIFNGYGVDESYSIKSNLDGVEKTKEVLKQDFQGFCFVNLVDFDAKYGHRNDVDGYAKAISEFDEKLPEIMSLLKDDDILMITADHGCDPSTPSTDHSREYIPLLIYGKNVKQNNNLHILKGFGSIGATIAEYLNVQTQNIDGKSVLKDILK